MVTTPSTKNGKNNLLNGRQIAFVQASERQSETSVILSIQEAEHEGVRPENFEKSGEGFETLRRPVYWMTLTASRSNPNMGVVYGIRVIRKI